MTMEADRLAIEAVKEGERERFAELIERHRRMVYAIGWSYLGDADLAEDAAQETFIKAYRYLGALREPGRFSGWLARIARNVSATLLRRRRTELATRRRWAMNQPVATEPQASGNAEEEQRETLERALAELEPRHRECLVLYYLEGKSVREAAALLGIREEALKTRLHRARHALRGKIEERIEIGLGRLEPSKNFAASVMLLLPEAPLGLAGVGGVGALGKGLGLFGKLLPGVAFFFTMAAANFASAYLLFRWYAGLEAKNLADRPDNAFRRAILRRNALTMGLGIVAVLVAVKLLTVVGGYLAMLVRPGGESSSLSLLVAGGTLFIFQFLSIYCAWGLYGVWRAYRINRGLFMKGQMVTMAVFLIVNVLIGFFDAPYPIFFVALLGLNLMFYRTNREMPRRQDYNLFLRHAQGILGDSEVETKSLPSRLTDAELQGFARFLGGQFLAVDARLSDGGLRLWLPPVRNSLKNMMLTSLVGGSLVTIRRDGVCETSLSRADRRAIESMIGRSFDSGAAAVVVAGVVRGALADFLHSREAAARGRLSVIAEEEIFVSTAFGKTRAHRIMVGIAIAATLVGLVAYSFIPGAWSRGNAFLMGWAPRPVTVEMAREAFGEWLETEPMYPTADLLMIWNQPAHPSMALLGEANAKQYREFVFLRLKGPFDDSSDGAVDARIFNALRYPYLLYHAVMVPILSPEKLAEIGFSPQRVRTALKRFDPERRRQLFTMGNSTLEIADSGEVFLALDIERPALKLRLLKHWNCLDLVDGEAIVEQLAALQVDHDFRPPDGFMPIDTEQAAGLIDTGIVSLRANHAALMALQALGALDRIDRQACADAILRFHEGGGHFVNREWKADGIWIFGSDEDNAFYALESLAILGDVDRVREDLPGWRITAKTGTGKKDGRTTPGWVRGEALQLMAMQERLELARQALGIEGVSPGEAAPEPAGSTAAPRAGSTHR
jgi:RNA polymerase sigma-70 factor (ECF subfamily)